MLEQKDPHNPPPGGAGTASRLRPWLILVTLLIPGALSLIVLQFDTSNYGESAILASWSSPIARAPVAWPPQAPAPPPPPKSVSKNELKGLPAPAGFA